MTISEGIDYRPPPAKALERGKSDAGADPRDHEAVGRKLVESLGHFGVEAKIVGIVSGPHVSRYELRLAPGTKVKKVTELANDLAYALASTDIRILAPIPGKQAVGVEVPNTRRRIVRLGDIYAGRPEKTSPLVAWLGKGIDGNAVWTDIAKMPHVLVAGTTGSGKSGCVNAILSSILMQASPNDVRLVLVDPKQVELNHYENVPHLLTPVVTSPRLAANVLANLIGEMESRYGIMGEARCPQPRRAQPGARQGRRSAAAAHPLRDRRARRPDDGLAGRGRGLDHPPRSEVARHRHPPGACHAAPLDRHHHRHDQGQHPGADRLRGLLADRLAGDPRPGRRRGAARPGRHALPRRRHLEAAAHPGRLRHRGGDRPGHRHWAKQGEPEFEAELLETVEEKGVEVEGDFDPDSDDLLDEAIRVVVETETASVSMIQRRLRVGYTRAGRLIDMLERRGVISGYEGSKPRQVLVSQADLGRLAGGEAPAEEAAAEPPAAVPE